MMHLRTIRINPPQTKAFPFNLPVIKGWEPLELESPVTFFVGENGTGKSTVMEALACAVGSITVGSQSVRTDPTLKAMRALGDTMRLSWRARTRKGFFLRAEDLFGYVKRMAQTRAEMEAEMREVDERFEGRSDYAKGLAKTPFKRELHGIEEKYGDGLDARSHGESFLALFQARFVPGGLYLLDEPEAALSPLRQIGFLSLLKEMVAQDAQFIIATHAPILMAYPGAQIFNFDEAPPRPVPFEQLEHVNLTRDFLNNPEQFLRHL